MTLVAIHQPNFFPWMGYFDKIRRADVFIFLDAVDYPRSGSGGMGSWTNRVRINLNGSAQWLTAPLRRAPLGTPISEVRFDNTKPWRQKMLRTLQNSYAKAPHKQDASAVLKPLLLRETESLAEFNMANIQSLAAYLGLQTRFIRQSTLPNDSRATQRLVDLVKAVEGTAYLSGGGAGGYQEDTLFAEAGLELVMQNYQPQPYGDTDHFIPGLSVIDYLMNAAHPPTSSFS